MKYSVQILGGGARDMAPSLLFKFDSQRYLFNCGEGTQRFCNEHKFRLPKLKNIFLTKLDWTNLGGIPGMLLTLNDVQELGPKGPIHLHGPPNLTRFMASLRHFIYPRAMAFEVKELPGAQDAMPATCLQDENLRIVPVLIFPTSAANAASAAAAADGSTGTSSAPNGDSVSSSSSSSSIPSGAPPPPRVARPIPLPMGASIPAALVPRSARATATKVPASRLPKRRRSPSPTTTSSHLPPQVRQCVEWLQGKWQGQLQGVQPIFGKQVEASVAYVCFGPEVRGKFDVKRAAELGLKPGRAFGKLQRGESVTMPDGKVIHPLDVMGPTRPSQVFVVLDLPNEDYLRGALASDTLTQHIGDSPALVFHMLGANLAATPTFQAFAKRFPASAKHFVFDPATLGHPVTFPSVAVSQTMLSTLVPTFFPGYVHTVHDEVQQLPKGLTGAVPTAQFASPLLEIGIEPRFELIQSDRAAVSAVAGANEMLGNDKKLRSLLSAKTAAAEAAAAAESVKTEPDATDATDAVMAESVKNEPDVNDVDMAEATTEATAVVANGVEANNDGGDWIVMPLGTGSAIPSQFRNVSSTLLSTPRGPVLFDCGEGTLGQLSRLFPPAGVADSATPLRGTTGATLRQRHPTLEALLGDLKLLFVSHLHADHHLGLTNILKHTTHPLTLVGPWRLMHYLRELDSFTPGLNLARVTFVDAEELLFAPRRSEEDTEQGVSRDSFRRRGSTDANAPLSPTRRGASAGGRRGSTDANAPLSPTRRGASASRAGCRGSNDAGAAKAVSAAAVLSVAKSPFAKAAPVPSAAKSPFAKAVPVPADANLPLSAPAPSAAPEIVDGMSAVAVADETEAKPAETAIEQTDVKPAPEQVAGTPAASSSEQTNGTPDTTAPETAPEQATSTQGTQPQSRSRGPARAPERAPRPLPPPPAALKPVLESLGLQSMYTANVIHRSFSYGVRVQSAIDPKLSIVFSGDTRPCPKLVQLGQVSADGTDLVLHEATFESDLQAEARKKQHSTTAEAVDVFEKMGARKLLLTHFSQRYPKLPKIERAMHPETIAVAFDLMAVPFRQFGELAKHAGAIRAVCSYQQQAVEQVDNAKNE
ncbi:tRNAse Z trz4, mitochondrial [Allomyces javanicus]|nr:tRNAse Z trz4, mitochondrial [Allomyces javanicus]